MADSVKKQQGRTGKPGRPKGSTTKKKPQQETAENDSRHPAQKEVPQDRRRNRFMKKTI